MNTRTHKTGAKWWICSALLGAVIATPPPARAQLAPPPHNVVALSARASVEVANDWLTLVFSVTRDGTDAAELQALLRRALDSALAEARKQAKPGQVEVRTGGFSLHPRYAPPSNRGAVSGLPGGIVGWQGSTELIVEGRDTQTLAQLVGRISTMTLARVSFSLSRQARDQVEAEVTAAAIARFRARADAVVRDFGMGSYQIREVSVSGDDQPIGIAPSSMRLQASRGVVEESLPVEAGKSLVSSSVSGSVQMLK